MTIETLDDIVENIANICGIYGTDRIQFTYDLKQRIERAYHVFCSCKDDWSDGTSRCQECGKLIIDRI